MTPFKHKSSDTLPQSALRSIDPVNYANAFVKPRTGYENMFARTIDNEFAESKKPFSRVQQRHNHKSSKRPLRTYSRLSGPERCEEPPRKKRVVELVLSEEDKENVPSSPQLPELPPQTAASTKKGSILAFFKPVSTSSSSAQAQMTSDLTAKSDETAPSSPPSSPPIPGLFEKRKRRLGARPAVRSSSPAGPRDKHEGAQEEGSGVLREAKSTGEDEIRTASHQSRRSSRRQPAKATVQTTLALTDDPGFTICHDCEMLYNPLNENDKKEHTRRHAAVLRKKREKEPPAAKK